MSKQKTPTYLDPSLADKIQHEDMANAKRMIDIDNVVGQYWSRADVTYNSSNSATNAKFYQDTLQEITKVQVVDDVAGSLNDTYFLINSGLDATEYYVWYNVNSAGTDPALVGKTGIEISLATNELDSVVAYATKLIMNAVASADFTVNNYDDIITIDHVDYGDTTDSSDFNTGFTVSVDRQGVSVLVKDYDITQLPNIRYVYNEVEKKFEINTTVLVESGINIPIHDRVDVTYPTTITEVYTYSLSAVTVATVTLTYTDSGKINLLSAVKS